MSVSNTTVKQLYTANGVTDTFAIPFAFIAGDAANVVTVYSVDEDGVLTELTAGVEYNLDPPPDDDPTNVVFVDAPEAPNRILVKREMPVTQIVDYINTGKFMAQDHEKGMDRLLLIIQELADRQGRSLEFNILDQGVVSFSVPKAEAGLLIGFNEDGDGIKLFGPSDLLALAGEGGTPPGGDTGSVLTKLSGDDYDAEWSQYAYEGFSARFNAAFSSANLDDTLAKILNIQYTAPLISLAASGSGTVREKGDEVTSSTLTATVTKRSDPIAEVRFYLNPSTLLDTQTSGGAIPDGGNSTYNWTGSFTDNTTFRAEVDDDGATGGPTTVSATASFTFVYPYYVGAGAAGLTPSQVAALTKRVITSTANRTETITAGAGEVLYFAYPASYGALTSILDVNNFETIGDWTLSTEDITGLDTNPVSYRIYEFNNPVAAGDYQYTFRR